MGTCRVRPGDRYFVYYSAAGTQPQATIGLLIGRTLDVSSPGYKWRTAARVPVKDITVTLAVR